MSSSRSKEAIGKQQEVNKPEDKDGAGDAASSGDKKNPTKKRKTVPFTLLQCEICGEEIYTNPLGLAVHKTRMHLGWEKKEKGGDHAESSNPTKKPKLTGDDATAAIRLLKCDICGKEMYTTLHGLKTHKGVLHRGWDRKDMSSSG
ncbi:hypothetical protein J5N97_015856 [Dioscorea zingiberensis]|uniref:C2H2-type domain-containing protein n=1 Tax=Dioscorea zingiberensis TaxID=325984 RepID=A0A9D5HEM5_9LILI|nr:hypothetical protein J5N97_015856 [Dioscorea zingiberensis]